MIYLSAAVVLVGLVAVVNLLLTIGVIRRLREHTTKLAGMPDMDAMKPAGERIGEFSTTTVDGMPISRELLAGWTMVGFFTPHCEPCTAMVPAFIERAIGVPGGRDRVLAVVLGQREEAAKLANRFAEVALVVLESDIDSGPLAQAFSVVAFPCFCVIDGQGVVIEVGPSPQELAIPGLA